MSNIENVKKYYSEWLDSSLEDFDKDELHSYLSLKRDQRQEGYSSNYLIYCVVYKNSVLLSYSNHVKDKVKALSGLNVNNIQALLKESFSEKLQCRQIYYYDKDDIKIDTTNAVFLTKQDYILYENFFKEQNPGLITEGWLKEYFYYLCDNGLCFGIYADNKLVSATDAPFIPYMSDIISEPGINTLMNYRKMGFAKKVCAKFIKHQINLNKTTIWTCRQNNEASKNLAEALGFIKFADLFTVEGNNSND
ncbi:MAG: acetyltransferase [Clostridia bacterium]|nr:acetyltransferase [Clostridia bacterium]